MKRSEKKELPKYKKYTRKKIKYQPHQRVSTEQQHTNNRRRRIEENVYRKYKNLPGHTQLSPPLAFRRVDKAHRKKNTPERRREQQKKWRGKDGNAERQTDKH